MPSTLVIHAGSFFEQTVERAVVATADATPASVTIFTVPDGATGKLALDVLARAADGTSKSWRFLRTGKTVAGVLTLVGAAPVTVVEADAGAAGWVAVLGASGTDVQVTLTGAAGVAIAWGVFAVCELLLA